MSRAILFICTCLATAPAYAAFPTVANTNTSSDTGTSHTVNLPASIANGNLLLVFTSCRDSTGTITFPAGWTIVGSEWTTGGSASVHARAALYRRTADGSEGASITVTTSVSNYCTSAALRVTGHHTTSNPELGTAVTGDSTLPDAPSLTPSWGAEDTLFMVLVAKGTGGTISSYPTGYTLYQLHVAVAATVSSTTAGRELNATSDNPGTMTASTSGVWGAQTLAIRPAAVADTSAGDILWFP